MSGLRRRDGQRLDEALALAERAVSQSRADFGQGNRAPDEASRLLGALEVLTLMAERATGRHAASAALEAARLPGALDVLRALHQAQRSPLLAADLPRATGLAPATLGALTRALRATGTVAAHDEPGSPLTLWLTPAGQEVFRFLEPLGLQD